MKAARVRTRVRSTYDGAGWLQWVPFVVILLILVLAPVLAYGQSADTVVVRWTAPGDDGMAGQAAAYDLRVSESPIDAANFEQASPVAGLPSPAPAGARQKIVVRGLSPGTRYYFAIRTRDDAGNWSSLSNVVAWDWAYDTAPPSAPASPVAEHDGSTVTIQWAASPDPDLAGYRVFRATSANGTLEVVSTGLVGTNQFIDAHLPTNSPELWYRVSAVDVHGNESGLSAPLYVSLTATAVTRVQVDEAYPNPSRMARPARIPLVVPASGVSGAYLEIVDSGNHRVRHQDLGDLQPGRQEIAWNGTNDAGQVCAPGVYRGWFVSGKDRQTIRIVRVP